MLRQSGSAVLRYQSTVNPLTTPTAAARTVNAGSPEAAGRLPRFTGDGQHDHAVIGGTERCTPARLGNPAVRARSSSAAPEGSRAPVLSRIAWLRGFLLPPLRVAGIAVWGQLPMEGPAPPAFETISSVD
jgi:hypothetical protein